MNVALMWAVYDTDGDRIALLATAEDAAALVSILGDGTTIRRDEIVLWTEGSESESAAESYDNTAEIVRGRYNQASVRKRQEVKDANSRASLEQQRTVHLFVEGALNSTACNSKTGKTATNYANVTCAVCRS